MPVSDILALFVSDMIFDVEDKATSWPQHSAGLFPCAQMEISILTSPLHPAAVVRVQFAIQAMAVGVADIALLDLVIGELISHAVAVGRTGADRIKMIVRPGQRQGISPGKARVEIGPIFLNLNPFDPAVR